MFSMMAKVCAATAVALGTAPGVQLDACAVAALKMSGGHDTLHVGHNKWGFLDNGKTAAGTTSLYRKKYRRMAPSELEKEKEKVQVEIKEYSALSKTEKKTKFDPLVKMMLLNRQSGYHLSRAERDAAQKRKAAQPAAKAQQVRQMRRRMP